MRGTAVRAALGASVLAVALGPGSAAASGFRCSRAEPNNGPSLNWTEREVRWGLSTSVLDAIDDDPAAVRAQVEAAFDAWTDVECSDIRLESRGVSGGFEVGFNPSGLNDNVVAHREDWPHDPEAIALTFTTFRTSSGALLDADIELNGSDYRFVLADRGCEDEVDLRNVLTHEVGHFVGLDHPPRTPRNEDTTMFGNAFACETKKRSLAEGDIEGLCTVYPRGQPTQQCYAPGTVGFEVVRSADGFDSGCRAARAPREVFLSLLALMAAARWHRRERKRG